MVGITSEAWLFFYLTVVDEGLEQVRSNKLIAHLLGAYLAAANG